MRPGPACLPRVLATLPPNRAPQLPYNALREGGYSGGYLGGGFGGRVMGALFALRRDRCGHNATGVTEAVHVIATVVAIPFFQTGCRVSCRTEAGHPARPWLLGSTGAIQDWLPPGGVQAWKSDGGCFLTTVGLATDERSDL